MEVSKAKLLAARRLLDLVVAGPRPEEIAEAEARLRAGEAQLALLRQQMKEAQLVSPVDAVVRTAHHGTGRDRLSPETRAQSGGHKSEMARVCLEPDLGKLKPGCPVWVSVDRFPGRRFEGWIGFVSPVAEFTPKTVQTEDLRTSLVYEVRAFVTDPGNQLRLGMPATVCLRATQPSMGVPTNCPSPVAPTTAMAEEAGR